MSDNPIVHPIKPTIDDDLDPFDNREVPACDENRLITNNDTTDSDYRNRSE